MPPAAATECERTGWTLLMSATVAPASAAASAARWPANPAPMIRTSCAAIDLSLYRATPAARSAPRRLRRVSRRGRREGATDLLDGHHAAQAVVAIDDHQGSERAQTLGAQEVLDRRVVAHAEGLVGLGVDDVGHSRRGHAPLHGAVHVLLAQQPQEAS